MARKTEIEKKYPLVMEAARTLTKRQLERALKFYERGGEHTSMVWIAGVGVPQLRRIPPYAR